MHGVLMTIFPQSAQHVRSENTVETTTARTVLTVPDISCAHCVQTVTRALTALDGVQAVDVDIPSKTVRVTHDLSRIGVERMAAALAAEDYPVAGSAGDDR
jgi:copper chaperone